MKPSLKQIKINKLILHNGHKKSQKYNKKNKKAMIIYPDYIEKENIKYQREEIFKRDFVFRKETKGVFKEDYMSTMFEMLYYNKKNYYVKRNQFYNDHNVLGIQYTEYPNLNYNNNTNLNTPSTIYPSITEGKNKSRNITQINLVKTFCNRRREEEKKTFEKDNEDEAYHSFESELNEMFDPTHKKAKPLKLYQKLGKTYNFFDHKEKDEEMDRMNLYLSHDITNKGIQSAFKTPIKKSQPSHYYTKSNQLQTSFKTNPKNNHSKIILTPNDVLYSKLFSHQKPSTKQSKFKNTDNKSTVFSIS